MSQEIVSRLILKRQPALPATIPQSIRTYVLNETDRFTPARGTGQPATICSLVDPWGKDTHVFTRLLLM
jgi:hypothetical protein